VALTMSYPGGIEGILSEQPAVRGAAVVGIPHPEFGEDVRAAVALKAEAGVTEDGIRDQFRTNLAAYTCSHATSGLLMSYRRLELPTQRAETTVKTGS